MYPLWIEKGKKVKFNVTGSIQLSENLEQCSIQGLNDDLSKPNNFKLGALLGRILGGPYFEIIDGLEFNLTIMSHISIIV